MKKSHINGLLIVLIILIFTLIAILKPSVFSQQSEKYSYTKAICDDKKYCEDYLIECDGKNLNKLTPTGFSIQQTENWDDERSEKEFCE